MVIDLNRLANRHPSLKIDHQGFKIESLEDGNRLSSIVIGQKGRVNTHPSP